MMDISINKGCGTDYLGISIRCSYGKQEEGAELLKKVLEKFLETWKL
jgi:hypothetical protein